MLNKEIAIINGQEVNVATVLDNTVEYKPTMNEAADIVSEAEDLLNKYFNCLDRNDGLWKMFSQDGLFWQRKGWLIEAFKKHPCYNGKYQIVLRDVDQNTYLNTKEIDKFFWYALDWIDVNAEYEDFLTKEIIITTFFPWSA